MSTTKIINFVCIILLFCSACIANGGARAIKPLAEDFKVIYRTTDPQNVYVYDPAIAVCPDGRLIGSFSLGGSGAKNVAQVKSGGQSFVYTSDDDGETWTHRANFQMSFSRPFVAGEKLYILGRGPSLSILSSDDWGDSWSELFDLTERQAWHGSATNVWYKDNYVYLVMERRMGGDMVGGWAVSELAPVLLRGDTTKDLTKRENWTFSSEMSFADAVDDKQLDWFGVPFHDSFYPDIKRDFGRCSFSPVGWLEANVVQIVDPKHYWYDPTGRTFHIFLRAHTGLTNLACVIKAVEQQDGSIVTTFQTAPSGRRHLYVPLPGGQMKFSVVYDEKSQLYWMASTQATDSMTIPQHLPKDRYCLSDNERRRLVLHFSKNMIDWCFAGVVSIGESERSSRHYCQMVIKDANLLIMSRSGDMEAKDAHNGNIVTFHKVKNFRELIY